MEGETWGMWGHKLYMYVYVYDCHAYAPTYFIWNNSWHTTMWGFNEVQFFSWVIEYPYSSIELLVTIFEHVIKLIWQKAFLYCLCRWGPLALAGLGTLIGGLMVLIGDRVMLWCCIWNYDLCCTIMWACALNFILMIGYVWFWVGIDMMHVPIRMTDITSSLLL